MLIKTLLTMSQKMSVKLCSGMEGLNLGIFSLSIRSNTRKVARGGSSKATISVLKNAHSICTAAL